MTFNRTQMTLKVLDGTEHLFDSEMEARFYTEIIEPQWREGKIKDVKIQPEYVLQDPFFHFPTKKKINGIIYTPDFEFTSCANGHRVVIEVKGRPTPDYELRKKIWLYQNPDKYYYIMQWSKGTGWKEISDYKMIRRQMKKEAYEERLKKKFEEEQARKQRAKEKLLNRKAELEAKPKLTKAESARLEQINQILGGAK